MSVERSIRDIFTRLEDWSRYPKYALERRLDIFLTPFLADFIADMLAEDAKGPREELILAMPEFPLRHRANHQTVNADYLLYRPGRNQWLIVELKTDAGSVSKKQLKFYRSLRAHPRTMDSLLGHIDEVREHSKAPFRTKYRRILRKLPELVGPGQREQLLAGRLDYLYLSPPSPDLNADELVSLDRLAGRSAWSPGPGGGAPTEAGEGRRGRRRG
jgi:hypothetical protein